MGSNATDVIPFTTMHPSECPVLPPQVLIPWNNSDNIVSLEAKEMAKKIKNTVILPITFLIGVSANVINMAVFYKQGLKERINVCLFALSLSDGLFLVAHMVAYGEQLDDRIAQQIYGPVLRWFANNCLLGLFGLTWVSQVLTAIVASERCFCVLQPLKSQTVLRTSTMTAIIVAVFIVVLGFRFIVVTRFYVVCAYNPVTNRIIYKGFAREFYRRNRKFVEFLEVFMFGVGVPWLAIVVIMTTTVITVIKLRQAAEWRMGKSSSAGSLSAREIALTRMLVGNSIFFIVCIFPVGLFRLTLLIVPEMNSSGRYENMFLLGLGLLQSISYINAAFNIIVYYTMGSRYRQTLWTLLGRKSAKDTPNKLSAATDKT